MASYRYERDIQPGDLKPRREKQYTRKERWANWWDYNLKWVILIGIAVAFVAYNFIGQYFFTTKADYNVAVVAPTTCRRILWMRSRPSLPNSAKTGTATARWS